MSPDKLKEFLVMCHYVIRLLLWNEGCILDFFHSFFVQRFDLADFPPAPTVNLYTWKFCGMSHFGEVLSVQKKSVPRGLPSLYISYLVSCYNLRNGQ